MYRTEKRTAVVTGGLVGIGRAISCALAANGILVGIGARRGDDPEMQKMARETIAPNTFVKALDLRREASAESFCTAVEAECGATDILVNAAGISIHQTVCGHGLKEWSDVIDTNSPVRS